MEEEKPKRKRGGATSTTQKQVKSLKASPSTKKRGNNGAALGEPPKKKPRCCTTCGKNVTTMKSTAIVSVADNEAATVSRTYFCKNCSPFGSAKRTPKGPTPLGRARLVAETEAEADEKGTAEAAQVEKERILRADNYEKQKNRQKIENSFPASSAEVPPKTVMMLGADGPKSKSIAMVTTWPDGHTTSTTITPKSKSAEHPMMVTAWARHRGYHTMAIAPTTEVCEVCVAKGCKGWVCTTSGFTGPCMCRCGKHSLNLRPGHQPLDATAYSLRVPRTIALQQEAALRMQHVKVKEGQDQDEDQAQDEYYKEDPTDPIESDCDCDIMTDQATIDSGSVISEMGSDMDKESLTQGDEAIQQHGLQRCLTQGNGPEEKTMPKQKTKATKRKCSERKASSSSSGSDSDSSSSSSGNDSSSSD